VIEHMGPDANFDGMKEMGVAMPDFKPYAVWSRK
jgi:hypothetical protein